MEPRFPLAGLDRAAPDEQRVFKRVGDIELRLHLFFPQPRPQAAPGIVFFFGGGWVNGTPTQFYPQCRYLARRGMLAVSAEYRVEHKHGTPPAACVEDGKSALRYLRGHAAELGLDPRRLAAGGGSAGGHVAAAAANCPGFDAAGEDLEVSARPDALVLFNPVFDNGPGGYGHARVKEYWKEFSPLHNIDDSTPPTVVFLGTKDDLVPVETAKEYQRRMEEKGRRCDLHLYEGRAHGFFNATNGDDYTRTVIEMDRFLRSLGFLEGEPTLSLEPVREDGQSSQD